MRPHHCAVFAILLVYVLEVACGRKIYSKHKDKALGRALSKHHHHEDRLFYHELGHNFDNYAEEDEKSTCHKVALHKCGQSFLKTFRLISYLTSEVAFKTKCAVRTAFFNCYKKIREKVCKSHTKPGNYKHEADFQKKLTDTLWSTRVCILGIKDIKNYPQK